ncbi:unnamed protein product, partial [Iphiclides podalirius]
MLQQFLRAGKTHTTYPRQPKGLRAPSSVITYEASARAAIGRLNRDRARPRRGPQSDAQKSTEPYGREAFLRLREDSLKFCHVFVTNKYGTYPNNTWKRGNPTTTWAVGADGARVRSNYCPLTGFSAPATDLRLFARLDCAVRRWGLRNSVALQTRTVLVSQKQARALTDPQVERLVYTTRGAS